MPKLKHRFRVSGKHSASPEEQSALDAIAAQCMAADLGTETLETKGCAHRTYNLILWLSDDVGSTLMRAIRLLQQKQSLFDLSVELLGPTGDEALETFTYCNCSLSAIQHSILSYNTGLDYVSLQLSPSAEAARKRALARGETVVVNDEPDNYKLEGSISRADVQQVVMKLLQISFVNMKHDFLETST